MLITPTRSSVRNNVLRLPKPLQTCAAQAPGTCWMPRPSCRYSESRRYGLPFLLYLDRAHLLTKRRCSTNAQKPTGWSRGIRMFRSRYRESCRLMAGKDGRRRMECNMCRRQTKSCLGCWRCGCISIPAHPTMGLCVYWRVATHSGKSVRLRSMPWQADSSSIQSQARLAARS